MSVQTTYGVMTRNGYVDIAFTERGAKNFATRHGYDQVWRRSSVGDFNVFLISTKVKGRWINAL